MRDQRRGEARFFVNGAFGAAALSAVMALCIARPAVAITINPIYDSSITSLSNAASIESAFNTVAGDYARSFAGNAVINVGVSWGSVDGYSLPGNAVGASVDNLYGYFSYSNIKGYLSQAASGAPSDSALATAVAHLPSAAPSGVGQYVVPSSEAKVLGLISPNQSEMDGYIGFAGSVADYTFNPASGIALGTYDFEAVAAHELDEVLGRISGLASSIPSYRTVFDLFRYSAPGTLDLGYNDAAYFSIDGGKTNLGTFNNSSSGGDRSDWLTTSTSSDVQDAFVSGGQALNLTTVDLTGLDALGYGGSNLGNSNAPPTTVAFRLVEVPEPGSLLLLLTGLMATLAAGAPLFRHRLFAERRSRPQSAAAAV
ncbi:MAG: NF038122 family metalloprotease [Acetobacteraceae bacterium]|nr:NF038122 family metalloprotease [Acetobacteraceae bacterium]